jgi:hypothetical protein
MSAMGERFVLFRLPVVDSGEQARRSLSHAGREKEMRAELTASVSALFATARREPRDLSDDEVHGLVSLTELVVRARSAIERDGYSREIELIPEPEAPTRLIVVLDRLLAGLDVIGVTRPVAWSVIVWAALDSIPALRRSVMDALLAAEEAIDTPKLAEALDYPTSTAKRALEDLTAHGIARRVTRGQGRNADTWHLTEWARERYSLCNPESARAPKENPGSSLSKTKSDFSESQTNGTIVPGDSAFPELVDGAFHAGHLVESEWLERRKVHALIEESTR